MTANEVIALGWHGNPRGHLLLPVDHAEFEGQNAWNQCEINQQQDTALKRIRDAIGF